MIFEGARTTGAAPFTPRMALSPVRRRLLEFVVAITALHGLAIASWYALDLEGAPIATRQAYAWVWLALSVVVTLVGLRRFHRARRAALGARARPPAGPSAGSGPTRGTP